MSIANHSEKKSDPYRGENFYCKTYFNNVEKVNSIDFSKKSTNSLKGARLCFPEQLQDLNDNDLERLLEYNKEYKFIKAINDCRDKLIDVDFDKFLRNCEMGKPIHSSNNSLFNGMPPFRKVEYRGELLATFREVLVLIYCKENNIKKSESLPDISLEKLSKDGKKLIGDIAKIFKKSYSVFNKSVLGVDLDEDSLKSKLLISNLNFFRELVEDKGWSLDDALDALSSTLSFIKNFNGESEIFFAELELYQNFYAKLVPFSKLVQVQEKEQKDSVCRRRNK